MGLIMLRTMMTDAQVRAPMHQYLHDWNEEWGDQGTWDKETAWSLTDPDDQAQAAQSRYVVDRVRPIRDSFQVLCAWGLMTVQQGPGLVDGVTRLRQSA